jgi:hypothetical protein
VQCGKWEDGCGGMIECGSCEEGAICFEYWGICVKEECEIPDNAGCCRGNRLRRCDGNSKIEIDCGEQNLVCGWISSNNDIGEGRFECIELTENEQIPNRKIIKECPRDWN